MTDKVYKTPGSESCESFEGYSEDGLMMNEWDEGIFLLSNNSALVSNGDQLIDCVEVRT